jgi:CBS domain-containing protein
MLAKDLMTRNVIIVEPENSIWHSLQILLDHQVSGLPVINDNCDLVGIVTEGDLLGRIELGVPSSAGAGPTNGGRQQVNAYLKSLSWMFDDLMTTELVVVDQDASLGRIASLTDKHKFRRVLVVDNKRLVGIISRKDLLQIIAMPSLHNIAPGDEALRLSILTRLGEIKSLRNAQLAVSVSDGVVRLGGKLSSDAERRLVGVVAESIRGVRTLCDDIEIVRGSRAGPRTKTDGWANVKVSSCS